MNIFEALLAHPLLTALGWALVHFIWQGAVAALLLAGLLKILRRQSSDVRYAAACLTLLLLVVSPLATLAIIDRSAPATTLKASPLPPDAAAPRELVFATAGQEAGAEVRNSNSQSSGSNWRSSWSEGVNRLFPWIMLGWLIGVAFFSLRLFGGWLYTQRLKKRGTRALDKRWQLVLQRLRWRLEVRHPVRILESAFIAAPMAIGWSRPVILIPTGALLGLTQGQLEAIIAHELAHIRRYDYLVNLLQAVVETLLFYHPAVWWVSRQIRIEREHCCDDLAVAACGNVLTYARALMEMEQLRAVGPQLAVAANGGLLMNRIHRLVGVQATPTSRLTGLFAGLIVMTTVISIAVGAQILPAFSAAAINQSDRAKAEAARQEAKQIIFELQKKADTARSEDASGSAEDDQMAEKLTKALQDSSWEVRKAAVETLVQLEGGRAVELLTAAMKDQHRQVREQAVIGLGAREDEKLAEQLLGALMDQDWQVREQAAIAIGLLEVAQNARIVEALFRGLVDQEWQVREQAARSLGVTGNAVAVAPLIHALGDRHEQVREAAAKSLGLIGDQRAIEPLNQSLQDGDEQVRKKAVEALTLIRKIAVEVSRDGQTPLLQNRSTNAANPSVNLQTNHNLTALSSSDANERAVAACALGKAGAVDAIPALINLLGDETPVQKFSCWGNGNWGPALHVFKQASPGEQAALALASFGEKAVEPLIGALSSGQAGARRNAAWALGEVRGGLSTNRSAAVEPLMGALGDSDPWVRTAAAFSLGEMRPRQAVEPLIAALTDSQSEVRVMAARALGEMKVRRGVDSLSVVLLRDEDPRVRRQAAWALGEIADPQSFDTLIAALKDQDQEVRKNVRVAISEIKDE
jgi:HEAT repeat protein/beta-lactamase regulating signal transducer with metallopeptidase domain